MWRKTLDVPEDEIVTSLRSLQHITGSDCLAEIVDAAAYGEPECVEEILQGYVQAEVLPLENQFGPLVKALLEAMEVAPQSDSDDDNDDSDGFLTDSSDDR